MPRSGDVEAANRAGMPCPYCGGTQWSTPLGASTLTSGVLVLPQLDEVGRPSFEQGVHVYAYACRDCGFVRFFTPDSIES